MHCHCVAGSVCTGVVARIDPQGAFIAGVYRDELGRAASPSEESAWRSSLGGGSSREAMAETLLAGSEYRARLISALHLRFLRRVPTPSDQSFWLSQLGAGASDEDVIAGLIGSSEYFANQAGGSNANFISKAYGDLLGRSPSATEQSYWNTFLTGGGGTREQMAKSLLEGYEFRSDLVTGLYQRLLHRAAAAAEQILWVNQLGAGASDEDLAAALIGSQEYFQRDPHWTATIDWGDGTSSPGVSSGGEVSGGHIYGKAGSFAVAVALSDDRGVSLSVATAASVAAGPIALTAPTARPGVVGLQVTTVKFDHRHGTAVASVSLPAAGTLRAGGKSIALRLISGSGAQASAVSTTVDSARTVKLLVRAKGRAKRGLDRTGRARVGLRLTFTPIGGPSVTEIRPIRLAEMGAASAAASGPGAAPSR